MSHFTHFKLATTYGVILSLFAVSLAGCTGEPDLVAAQRCLDGAQWAKAVEHLDEAVRAHPASAQALVLRGKAKLKLSKFQAAIEDLHQADKLNPHLGSGALLVEAHLALGDYKLAETIATTIPDETPTLLVFRGRARLAQAKLAEAQADFQQALQGEPKNDQALFYLGVLFLEKKDYKEAESCLTKSITEHPNHAKAFWLRALARDKLQQADGAETDRATAKDLDPTFQFADSAMGRNLLRTVADDKADPQSVETFNTNPSP